MPAIDSLVIWQTVEGGGGADGAKWNPLNTTWKMPDATNFNDDGVESYAAMNDGLNATAMTLGALGYGIWISRHSPGARDR